MEDLRGKTAQLEPRFLLDSALGRVFFVPDKAAAAYTMLAAIATAAVFAAVSAALEPMGMPTLTLPFVLVVWLFVLAGPIFPGLRPAPVP